MVRTHSWAPETTYSEPTSPRAAQCPRQEALAGVDLTLSQKTEMPELNNTSHSRMPLASGKLTPEPEAGSTRLWPNPWPLLASELKLAGSGPSLPVLKPEAWVTHAGQHSCLNLATSLLKFFKKIFISCMRIHCRCLQICHTRASNPNTDVVNHREVAGN